MPTYRFHIETPWAAQEHDEDVEFDHEPTDAELDGVLDGIYGDYFPGSYARIDSEGATDG